MNKEIYQDQVKIIGTIKKLDSLRVSRMGLPSFYLVISIPNAKANNPIYLPCTIYGKKAEELGKQVQKLEIKAGDTVEAEGSHVNKYINSKLSLEIKLNSITKQSNTLFEG